jgi:predicted ATPase
MKFVITGGPGSGKTATIEALKKRCDGWPEQYYFVNECAEEVIVEYQRNGIKNPTKLIELQYKIAKLQKEKEQEIPPDSIVFLDRTMIDTLAYDKDPNLLEMVVNESKKANYAPFVFFMLSSPEIYRRTEIRQETYEEAIELSEKVRCVYNRLGYHTIDIPMGAVECRAKDIFWAVRNYLKEKNIINN